MIFVTVGTHEQQFNRLVQQMDQLRADGSIAEDVIIQTGYSDYVPTHCEYSPFYPYQKMIELVGQARIVITHGGPSSFIMPLQAGKIPVVVPRKSELLEHVNNHQADFCRAVSQRMANIILVEDTTRLGDVIREYDFITARMQGSMESNNDRFCAALEQIVDGMFCTSRS